MNRNRRILLIDDNAAILRDYRKILLGQDQPSTGLDALQNALFGGNGSPSAPQVNFEVESAMQGQEGLQRVLDAQRENRPYALAFVDVRMPPGWDGIETIERIWKEDPLLQVVICTAYSDYSWDDMILRLGQTDQLVLLKKPFESSEVLQLALALTEKWNLAREARLRAEDLEHRVTARTRELAETNQRLQEEMTVRRRTEEQLQQMRVAESVGQLAAGVAHHFNNILQVILGNVHTLTAASASPEEIRESAHDIAKVTERASALTYRLLAYSRQELLRCAALDLNAVVQRAVEKLAAPNGKPVAWEFTPANGLPAVSADAALLGQVVELLGENAAEAAPPGSTVLVTTRAVRLDAAAGGRHPEARPGHFVCLTVRDEGRGMDERTRTHAFEPFFTTKPVGKGAGLGLPTAYGIVKQHEGWIELRSAPGEGTAVEVYLPQANGTPAESR